MRGLRRRDRRLAARPVDDGKVGWAMGKWGWKSCKSACAQRRILGRASSCPPWLVGARADGSVMEHGRATEGVCQAAVQQTASGMDSQRRHCVASSTASLPEAEVQHMRS